MDQTQQGLETLQDIKRIMERSSRFISLSGWSGIAAGLCALAGAWAAVTRIVHYKAMLHLPNNGLQDMGDVERGSGYHAELRNTLSEELLWIAIVVFCAAFILSFLFTYIRSRKNKLPIWDQTARRLLWNTLVPLIVGGIVVLKVLEGGHYLLIAPLCLIFYGLALINGGKYTLGEVKYLGYGQILLGLVNLWMPGWGLVLWAIGFGVLHILYGAVMWWKYERS